MQFPIVPDADDPAFFLKVTTVPPEEGPLSPCAGGWYLGSGKPGARLFPGLSAGLDRPGRFVVVGTVSGGLMHNSPLGGAVAAAALLGVAGATGSVLARRIVSRQLREARELSGPLREVSDGTLLKLRGLLPEQETARSLFASARVVLARNRLGPADELRGFDFTVSVGTAESVLVEVRHALLLDPPRPIPDPACGPVAVAMHPTTGSTLRIQPAVIRPSPLRRLLRGPPAESSVGPGDTIEVFGFLHQIVAVDGTAGIDRGPPLRQVLRGQPGRPCLIRRIAGP